VRILSDPDTNEDPIRPGYKWGSYQIRTIMNESGSESLWSIQWTYCNFFGLYTRRFSANKVKIYVFFGKSFWSTTNNVMFKYEYTGRLIVWCLDLHFLLSGLGN
jgi:hypothetical protein